MLLTVGDSLFRATCPLYLSCCQLGCCLCSFLLGWDIPTAKQIAQLHWIFVPPIQYTMKLKKEKPLLSKRGLETQLVSEAVGGMVGFTSKTPNLRFPLKRKSWALEALGL